jgi:lipopolysaccharide/colanic/teichoic acid biosynthesis glycosyltransferase
MIKRILNVVVCVPVVLILLPVFVVIAVAIKLSSKGPVIFKQERVGKNGKPFIFYKFRTMKVDVDPFGPSPKAGDDPCLTKVGKFLREYSLDEFHFCIL